MREIPLGHACFSRATDEKKTHHTPLASSCSACIDCMCKPSTSVLAGTPTLRIIATCAITDNHYACFAMPMLTPRFLLGSASSEPYHLSSELHYRWIQLFVGVDSVCMCLPCGWHAEHGDRPVGTLSRPGRHQRGKSWVQVSMISANDVDWLPIADFTLRNTA
jgi:hypothetical protein